MKMPADLPLHRSTSSKKNQKCQRSLVKLSSSSPSPKQNQSHQHRHRHVVHLTGTLSNGVIVNGNAASKRSGVLNREHQDEANSNSSTSSKLYDVDELLHNQELSIIHEIIYHAEQQYQNDNRQFNNPLNSLNSTHIPFDYIQRSYEHVIGEYHALPTIQNKCYARLLRMNADSEHNWWQKLANERLRNNTVFDDTSGVENYTNQYNYINTLALYGNGDEHTHVHDDVLDRIATSLTEKRLPLLQLTDGHKNKATNRPSLSSLFHDWRTAFKRSRARHTQHRADTHTAVQHGNRSLRYRAFYQWLNAWKYHKKVVSRKRIADKQYDQHVVRDALNAWLYEYRHNEYTNDRCIAAEKQYLRKLLRYTLNEWMKQLHIVQQIHGIQRKSKKAVESWSQLHAVRYWHTVAKRRIRLDACLKTYQLRHTTHQQAHTFTKWHALTNHLRALHACEQQHQLRFNSVRLHAAFHLWHTSSKRHAYCMDVVKQRYNPVLQRRLFHRWKSYAHHHRITPMRNVSGITGATNLLSYCTSFDVTHVYDEQRLFEHQISLHNDLTIRQHMTDQHIASLLSLLSQTGLSVKKSKMPIILKSVFAHILHNQREQFIRWKQNARILRQARLLALQEETYELNLYAQQVHIADHHLHHRLCRNAWLQWKSRMYKKLQIQSAKLRVHQKHVSSESRHVMQAWLTLTRISAYSLTQTKRRAVKLWRWYVDDKRALSTYKQHESSVIQYYQKHAAIKYWRKSILRKRVENYNTLTMTLHRWRDACRVRKQHTQRVSTATGLYALRLLSDSYNHWSGMVHERRQNTKNNSIADDRYKLSCKARGVDYWYSFIRHRRRGESFDSMLTQHADKLAKIRVLRKLAAHTLSRLYLSNDQLLAANARQRQLCASAYNQWKHCFMASKFSRIVTSFKYRFLTRDTLQHWSMQSRRVIGRHEQMNQLAVHHYESRLTSQAFSHIYHTYLLHQRSNRLAKFIEFIWLHCLHKWTFRALRSAVQQRRQLNNTVSKRYDSKLLQSRIDCIRYWHTWAFQKACIRNSTYAINADRMKRAIYDWKSSSAGSRQAREHIKSIERPVQMTRLGESFTVMKRHMKRISDAIRYDERRQKQYAARILRTWLTCYADRKRQSKDVETMQVQVLKNTLQRVFKKWSNALQARREAKRDVLERLVEHQYSQLALSWKCWKQYMILLAVSKQSTVKRESDITKASFRVWVHELLEARRIVRTSEEVERMRLKWVIRQVKTFSSILAIGKQLNIRADQHYQRRASHSFIIHWGVYVSRRKGMKQKMNSEMRKIQLLQLSAYMKIWQYNTVNAEQLKLQIASLEEHMLNTAVKRFKHHQLRKFFSGVNDKKRVAEGIKRVEAARNRHQTMNAIHAWHSYSSTRALISHRYSDFRSAHTRRQLASTFIFWYQPIKYANTAVEAAKPHLSRRLLKKTFKVWRLHHLLAYYIAHRVAEQMERSVTAWYNITLIALQMKKLDENAHHQYYKSLQLHAYNQWIRTYAFSCAVNQYLERRTASVVTRNKRIVIVKLLTQVKKQRVHHSMTKQADALHSVFNDHLVLHSLLLWAREMKRSKLTDADVKTGLQFYRSKHSDILQQAIHTWMYNVERKKLLALAYTHTHQRITYRITKFVLVIWQAKFRLQIGQRQLSHRRAHNAVSMWLSHVKEKKSQKYIQSQVEKAYHVDGMRIWYLSVQQLLTDRGMVAEMNMKLRNSGAWQNVKHTGVMSLMMRLNSPAATLPFSMKVWTAYVRQRRLYHYDNQQASQHYIELLYRSAFTIWKCRQYISVQSRVADAWTSTQLLKRGVAALEYNIMRTKLRRSNHALALHTWSLNFTKSVFTVWIQMALAKRRIAERMKQLLLKRCLIEWRNELLYAQRIHQQYEAADKRYIHTLLHYNYTVWRHSYQTRHIREQQLDSSLPFAVYNMKKHKTRRLFIGWFELYQRRKQRRMNCQALEQLLPLIWQRNVFTQWRRVTVQRQEQRITYILHRCFYGWKLESKRLIDKRNQLMITPR